MKLSMEDSYRFLPQDIRQNCEAMTSKSTQISRVSEKSLLCNVSKSVSDKIIGVYTAIYYMYSLSHLSKETGFLPSPFEMHFHF